MKRTALGLLAASTLLSLHATLPARAQQAAAESLDPHANETKAQRDARMKWWREARFGMFIHWGLYAVPAGVYNGQDTHGVFSAGAGEWIMHDLHIPVDTYAAYAKQFDPEQFNADQWVSVAKAAGMKYIVMTAKHHEGFAMYPTKVDDFNINAKTAFKRDPIGEMSAACKKAGIKFGVYYSQNLDWHHPGGGTAGDPWDDAQKGDFDAYVKNVSAPQVRELLTKYKPAVLWWDINGPFNAEQVKLLTAAFPSDPGLIANNRLGGGVPGDTETPEQYVPATGFPGKDWETCMTINNTWGFKTHDTNFKSTETLLHNLIDIASKGGNYLLNVGPTAQGIIPQPEIDRLKQMGDWMKANGESVYATTASPYKRLPFDGRATVKGKTLYLNVFTWPETGLTLKGLQTPVREAKVVATGQKLTVTRAEDGTIAISKPATLDPVSTAIALKLSGSPVVTEEPFTIAPQTDGTFLLKPNEADLQGNLQVEGGDPGNIGYWTNSGDTASWTVKAPADGVFQAKIEYACDPNASGSTYTIQIDGVDTVSGSIEKTANWQDYRTVTLPGTIAIPAGVHHIRVKPTSMPNGAVMNLRAITLTPA
jgi:alpha-L-fucosidase